MLKQFLEFKTIFDKEKIKTTNNKLEELLGSYSFYYIINESEIYENQSLLENLESSKVAIIKEFTETNFEHNDAFSIVNFKKTIILIHQSLKILLDNLLSKFPKVTIFYLPNEKSTNEQKESNSIFLNEISKFNESFQISRRSKLLNNPVLKEIKQIFAGYLIKEGYANLRSNNDFNIFSKIDEDSITEFDEDEFIKIRDLNQGSSFKTKLVYHIEREKLFVIKVPSNCLYEEKKLLERENKNYHEIKNFHLPKYYGIIKDKNYPVIEFIDGQTLENIEILNLKYEDKIAIIIEIMITIKYLHQNCFVYRDLKPNNIIIDKNKRVYLIDFDRMLKYSKETESDVHTNDFSSIFVAPEVCNGVVKYENDIYSIGQIIYYIMSGKYPTMQEEETKKYLKDSNLYQIYSNCVDNIDKRPLLQDLLIIMIFHYIKANIEICKNQLNSNIEYLYALATFESKYNKQDINKAIHYYSLAANHNDQDAQFYLGLIYEEGKCIERDINKAIHYYSLAANQNHPDAQYNLGVIYENGKYIERNINKSIHYYSLAANQNHPRAQNNLGVIYSEGKYIEQDINKAIHYYSLAANQNHPDAQYNLGAIYESGEYIERDINKAIYYFSFAANQNHSEAQFYLGVIYYEGKYIERDINKSIYYYSLAANQNHPKAQLNLGVIYCDCKYIKRNLDRSIYYFSLAANQNLPDAQFNLGLVYESSKCIERDINRAIYYNSLAANQNHPEAQNNLGFIYKNGEYIERDINKAIYYFSLAANQNHPNAQYNLGDIYESGKYIEQDINKAIYYYSLAANQNHPEAQFRLGLIYESGECNEKDIEIFIHYITLAANQNHPDALFILAIIYYEGEYVKQDIYKFIHYLSLAANQNQPYAQFNLGFIYFEGIYLSKNIQKAINYFILSSYLRCKDAHFVVGFLYHEGKYINKNVMESIHYYKEGSNLYDQYCKNNLGIIYRYGEGKIKRTLGNANDYFKEAIKQKNDKISMYNLAHMYIYEDIKVQIEELINLLIKSSKQKFLPSKELLCILLMKKYEYNINQIRKELKKLDISNDEINSIIEMIQNQQLKDPSILDKKYNYYKDIVYLYNIDKEAIKLIDLNKTNEDEKNNELIEDITPEFYEGFGNDLLYQKQK